METKSRPGKPQRGIQSVEVGGQLLLALLQRGRPTMLRDLARDAGMLSAKAHPYMVSFGKLGLVEQDGETGLYDLGPLALQLGLSCLHRLDPLRAANLEAPRLAEETELVAAITVWGNRGPTVVGLEDAGRPIHVNMRVGAAMPLLDSATGQVFAAYLPESTLLPCLAREWPEMPEAPEAFEPAAQQEAVAAVARERWQDLRLAVVQRGLAQALGTASSGVNALAAPVLDARDRLALVITLLGPAATFDAAWDGPAAEALRVCVARIGERLGRPPRLTP